MLTGAKSQATEQCSVWLDGLLGRGGASAESPARVAAAAAAGEEVRRGYFHDPISIREAKLFMPSA